MDQILVKKVNRYGRTDKPTDRPRGRRTDRVYATKHITPFVLRGGKIYIQNQKDYLKKQKDPTNERQIMIGFSNNKLP